MDIKDLIFLTREEFLDPEISLQVLSEGERVVRGIASADAYRMARALQRILTPWDEAQASTPTALELHYGRLLELTRVIAIPLLSNAEAVEAVKTSLAESLRHPEFDLDAYKAIFKRKLLTIPVTARDVYKEELRRALHENEERLTQRYLVVEGKEQLGTIGNWLGDYIRAVGGGEVDSLRRAEYFATRRVDEADRVALKKLIDLYEFLKLSSVSAQGVEEYLSAYYPELGKYFILNEQGLAEEIPEVSAVFKQATAVEAPQTPKVELPKIQPGKVELPQEEPPKIEPQKIETQKLVVKREEKSPVPAVRLPAVIMHEDHPLRTELQELIDQVLKNVELKMQNVEWLKDPVLEKRVRSIVSARLRDIRDATETREMLGRDRKVGGMGLSGELGIKNQELGVDTIVEIIEKAFQEFQGKWRAVEDKRRAERKKEQQSESHKQEQLEVEQEQKDLEERYQRLTGVISKPQAPVSKEIPKPKITISKTPPPLPMAISQPVKAVVIPSKPPRPSPPPSALSSQGRELSAVSRKPEKITDIRQPAKLMGPLDELRSLTLEDFRKLGGQVQERVDKILGKLEFIGQESLSRRMAAIAAWKQSPLYGLYGKITAEALTQKVSPEQLARGQSTLTREEFYAIMELNQKLRF